MGKNIASNFYIIYFHNRFVPENFPYELTLYPVAFITAMQFGYF